MSRSRRLAIAIALAVATIDLHAGDDGPYASGSLAWIFSDRLDLVGTMAAEVPLAEASGWRIFVGARAVTAIETATNFTFLVDQVSYDAGFGARRKFSGARGAVAVFAFEQGRVGVDTVSRARVRELGASWESAAFREAFGPDGWSGRVATGVVVEHSGVDAVASFGGSVRWMHHVGRKGATSIGCDATIDALLGHDHGTDILAGPRVEFDLGGDRRFGLYARWLQGGNPLGLETDGLLVGFDLAQGPRGEGARAVPPEIAGLMAAGAGDGGRGLARLDLRVASPPFLDGTYAQIEVNGNVLTASDLNDLFYLYDVGIVHLVNDWRPGVWFHHRSNHVLNEDNPTVTSTNALEAGIESPGWNRSEPGVPLGRAGAIDAMAYAGWVQSSSFSQDALWDARGGFRWASPSWGNVRLYVSAEAQRGTVDGSVYGIGCLLPRGWDVRVEKRHDEELYSVDQRALLGVAILRF